MKAVMRASNANDLGAFITNCKRMSAVIPSEEAAAEAMIE